MSNSGFLLIWNQSTVDNGGVSRGRSVAVGVSDRWKVTCDTPHCDLLLLLVASTTLFRLTKEPTVYLIHF